MSDPIVIIGSGLAGYNLAREFRKLDKETGLVMITSDDGTSYSKPMLSTGFTKNKTAEQLGMADAAKMAAQINATIRTNTEVTSIDASEHSIHIGDEVLSYSKLVLAWGAGVINPPLSGDGLDEVYSVNDLEDYSRFRQAIVGRKRVLIIGAGLIGCEFANDLTNGDHQCTVVDPLATVLPTLLPETAANAVQQGLTDLGVEFKLGPLVSSVDKGEQGLVVSLSTGETVETDIVVSAIGLRPRIDLAAKAQIATNKGVCVNRLLQTNQEDIYSLGDCAEVEGQVLLYVLPLMASARALAKTLTGQETKVSYPAMPVTIKTPACPVVVSPPATDAQGQWYFDQDGINVKAEFKDAEGNLLGFALTGSCISNKQALTKLLPAMLG